jgi:hypothetical protein
MRPAFSSTKQASAFALLLLVLLVLPVVMGKNLLPAREEIYTFQGNGIGPWPWIRQQIFEETNDIDIAFVGSSKLLHDIDTPYVQAKLSEQIGRQATVRSICWGGGGYDILYLISQDLLEHRRVKMLVFYDEDGEKFRNPSVPLFFRWSDNSKTLTGLPSQDRAVFYFAALIEIPRNVLALMRPEIPADIFPAKPNIFETTFISPNPASRLGSVSAQRGYNPDFGISSPFLPHTPYTDAPTADVSIYSEPEKHKWIFDGLKLPAWQTQFARKFVKLAHDDGCKLVMLHLPGIDAARSPKIQEREFWPAYLDSDLTMVGISESNLFARLTDDEIRTLYFDPKHFNQNGQEFFAPVITPTLISLYETIKNP